MNTPFITEPHWHVTPITEGEVCEYRCHCDPDCGIYQVTLLHTPPLTPHMTWREHLSLKAKRRAQMKAQIRFRRTLRLAVRPSVARKLIFD